MPYARGGARVDFFQPRTRLLPPRMVRGITDDVLRVTWPYAPAVIVSVVSPLPSPPSALRPQQQTSASRIGALGYAKVTSSRASTLAFVVVDVHAPA
jgi:hypothetical protein